MASRSLRRGMSAVEVAVQAVAEDAGNDVQVRVEDALPGLGAIVQQEVYGIALAGSWRESPRRGAGLP